MAKYYKKTRGYDGLLKLVRDINDYYKKNYTVEEIFALGLYDDFIEKRFNVDDIDKILNWENISKHKYLSKDFIFLNKNRLCWKNIVMYQKLDERTIEILITVYNKDIWDLIFRYQILSEDFLEKYEDTINWNYIAKYQTLSEDYINKHLVKLNLSTVLEYQKLSVDFLDKYSYIFNQIDWICISSSQVLSEDFIRKHLVNLNITYVLKVQNLSIDLIEEIILKYSNKLNWDTISTYQKLSEEFILKYKEFVNWGCIELYQDVSKSFLMNNIPILYDDGESRSNKDDDWWNDFNSFKEIKK